MLPTSPNDTKKPSKFPDKSIKIKKDNKTKAFAIDDVIILLYMLFGCVICAENAI